MAKRKQDTPAQAEAHRKNLIAARAAKERRRTERKEEVIRLTTKLLASGKWSQEQLARFCKVRPPAVGDWATGKHVPSGDTFERLVEAARRGSPRGKTENGRASKPKVSKPKMDIDTLATARLIVEALLTDEEQVALAAIILQKQGRDEQVRVVSTILEGVVRS